MFPEESTGWANLEREQTVGRVQEPGRWPGIETQRTVGGSSLGHTAVTDTGFGFWLSHLLKWGLWAELATLAWDSFDLSDLSRMTGITERTW